LAENADLHKACDMLDHNDGFVDITSHQAEKFLQWPHQELRKVVASLAGAATRVADGRMTRARFDDLQKVTGFNYNGDGMLFSNALQNAFSPLDVATYDWAHTLLQDGVFVTEASLLVRACHEHLGVLAFKSNHESFVCSLVAIVTLGGLAAKVGSAALPLTAC
jgi:hypothetical protein